MERKLVGQHFVVYLKKNPARVFCLDIKVNRQIKGAVQRNRIKRVLREFFRNQLPLGHTVVCIARPGAGQADNHDLFQDLSKMWG